MLLVFKLIFVLELSLLSCLPFKFPHNMSHKPQYQQKQKQTNKQNNEVEEIYVQCLPVTIPLYIIRGHSKYWMS